jgi:non-homologous end joining protein Ku
VGTTKRKEKRRKKTPYAKNPRKRKACHNINDALLQSIAKTRTQAKYREEKHKDVARILAAHPPKTVEREHK